MKKIKGYEIVDCERGKCKGCAFFSDCLHINEFECDMDKMYRKLPTQPMNCETCKHVKSKVTDDPCDSCTSAKGIDNYEPADTQELALRNVVEILDDAIFKLQQIRQTLTK